VLAAAAARELSPLAVDDFEALVGRGVRATIDQTDYYVGSPKFFDHELGLSPEGQLAADLEEHSGSGSTLLFVGTAQELLGALLVADRIRPGAKKAVARLRSLGVDRIALLTGDNTASAQAAAEKVGIDEVRAELLPEDKALAVQRLSEEVGTTAMVGDGINDAPALAAADIGIAMGAAGTDTALRTADIALMSDDLARVPHTMHLSRQTLRRVGENITAAIGLKLVAALLIVPGWLTLWMAVLADVGATVVVSLNGMRLLRS
jgi:Cd2+/Zn2+-exporting ATPase